MRTLLNILESPPKSFFVGVVELDGSSLIGVIDEPVGIELQLVRLSYPLEFLVRHGKDNMEVVPGFINPELGIPEEIVLEAGSVSVHAGDAPFAQIYFEALRRITKGPQMKYEPVIIRRPAPGGTNGAGERHKNT